MTLETCNDSFHDDFKDNRFGWEVTDKKNEFSAIMNDEYVMINKSKSRWNYYHMPCSCLIGKHWQLEASLTCDPHDACNKFGLMWGFGLKAEVFNRFSLSADGEHVSIVCFDRNHHRIYHRFYTGGLNVSTTSEIRMSIIRNGNYYFFTINQQTVYISHVSHFMNLGNRFGFYVEPGLTIRSQHIICQETKPEKVKLLKDQLLLF
jgi:hypothetical protein